MKSVIYPSRKKWLFFAILWGSFVLLCSQFPYVSDDWVWGMDGRFSAFIDSFTDTNSQMHFYNTGRYLGNGLGFVAANHPVFRNIMMGTTLTLITALIASICATISLQKDELTDIFTALSVALLLLILPKERFRQGIAWSSAFMIYVVGACFSLASLLIFLRLFRGQVVSAWACVLLPFLSAFFVENLSIGNVLFFGAVVVTILLKRKTVSAKIWL